MFNDEEIKNIKFMDFFKEKLDEIEVENNEKLPFVGGAYGTMAYDIIREFENIPNNNPDELKVPDSDMFFVKEGVIYDHYHEKITIVVLVEEGEGKKGIDRLEEIKNEIFDSKVKISFPQRNSSVKPVYSNTTKEEYMKMVEKSKEYIREGDIFQVVLSQRWSMEQDMHPFEIYRVLRSTNPSPYLFYFNFGDYKVAGSSPEMLVEMKNNRVKNCPIAGTRKRGKTLEKDLEMENELINDVKERAEHLMLVDLGRNDVGRVAKPGTVKVTDLMRIERYSHVMHIVSDVEAIIDDKYDMFDLFMATFTAGTMTGAPKIRAMELIAQFEGIKRNFYSGSIAYFGFDGNMDSAITIRTTMLTEDTVIFQAGAGVVADSKPEDEYLEVHNKLAANIATLKDLS